MAAPGCARDGYDVEEHAPRSLERRPNRCRDRDHFGRRPGRSLRDLDRLEWDVEVHRCLRLGREPPRRVLLVAEFVGLEQRLDDRGRLVG
jgi:hypothetical protein